MAAEQSGRSVIGRTAALGNLRVVSPIELYRWRTRIRFRMTDHSGQVELLHG